MKSPTSKRHRRSNIKNSQTVSFTLDKRLVEHLESVTDSEPDKNMSRFIEDTVFPLLPFRGEIPGNRPYKSYPQKKTFTFTEDFVSLIKAHGNMSLLVETILVKKMRLNLK